MEHRGKILLVDDNEQFVSTTSTLLKRHGYQCDCEHDGHGALARLDRETYDVLVSDIKMKGNEDLELIEKIGKSREGLPVILVTGHPTVETAIRSVRMPVMAYMVKPFEFKDLLGNIELAVMKTRLAGRINTCRRRFDEIETSLLGLGEMVKETPADGLHLPLEMFMDLTARNLADCVADISYLMRTARQGEQEHVCGLYNCPRLDLMKQCLKDSVEVLERTKGSFKSKELALLRKRMEDLLSRA
jgi:DNA-binding response OmpR family regulator